ncbi:MAG: formyltransferase family protein [Candidatus Erginobacter occultus]|nr:formyltransferase family protein [Candidatus Erginobacter occultus]
MRIFLLIENERTYQPRIFDRLIRACPDEVVGIGLVPFDPRNRGWKFFRFYLRFLGLQGTLRKALQLLWQHFRSLTRLSRVCGPPASIKELARRHQIPLLKSPSPNRKEFRERVKALKPDLVISSQGFLLKKEFLSIAPLGCLNRHAALLPKYRGIYPIFWAMLHDEREIGISVHFMNEKYDEGKIIIQHRIPVEDHDTFFSLYDKVIALTPVIFLEAIGRIREDRIPEIPNRSEEGSYYSYPKPEDIRRFREQGKKIV